MASQTDLDQGGTQRQWVKSYMGPSVGWVTVPLLNQLPITAAGTVFLDPSSSFVQVNSTGAVTVVLPSSVNPAVGPQAQPRLFADTSVTVADVGGNAGAHPITIFPFYHVTPGDAGETIMGLASIQISVNYGSYTLAPNSAQKTWNNVSS